jgi:Icc-related predicted phosphoesterase
MKILTISDTHGLHNRIPKSWLVPADIIIHGGDSTNRGYLTEIDEFCKWYNDLEGYNHKILIAGNHDFGFQDYPEKINEILAKYPNIIYLKDSSVIIDGVRFYGSPWQPTFFNWAFNLDRGLPILEKWKLIHDDASILITHGPPYELGDKTTNGLFVGCVDLLNEITNRLHDTKIHIFGHIHEGYGCFNKHNKLFINASTLNEDYKVTNKPILIEYDKENKTTKIINLNGE